MRNEDGMVTKYLSTDKHGTICMLALNARLFGFSEAPQANRNALKKRRSDDFTEPYIAQDAVARAEPRDPVAQVMRARRSFLYVNTRSGVKRLPL